MRIKFGAATLLMNEMGADGADAGGAGAANTSDTPSADETPVELDFGGLMDEEGDDNDSGGTAPATTPTAAAQPTTPPEQSAQPPAAAPATPVAAPAAPAPSPSSSAAEPTPSVDPNEQRMQARQAAYAGLVGSWQQQLTPDVVEQVMTDPAAMLPQLMAQVELRAMETAIGQITQQIPAMIANYNNVQTQSKSLADAFFGEFPALAAHEDAVAAAVTRFQQMPGFDFRNPEHRQQVAGALMMQLKIAPQAPAPQAPAPTVRPTPSPAGSSAAPVAAPASAPTNVWAKLLEDDIYPE